MSSPLKVEFPTVDGLTLRGLLFPARSRGPGIIMTPGTNMPISDLYHAVSEHFREAGFTVLVYDPRGIGTSDGTPNEIDPAKQTEDFQDAVTFLKGRPQLVDPARIALWGYSLSATEALAAASVDRRVRAVVIICPAVPFDLDGDDRARREAFLQQAMRDRESRLRGNRPFYSSFVGKGPGGGDDAVFDYRELRGQADVEYDVVMAGLAIIPNFRNRIAVASFRHVAAWPWRGLLRFVSPTPVLQINAAEEEFAYIRKIYEDVFSGLTEGGGVGPELHVELDKGHMDILNSDARLGKLMDVQIRFLRKHLGGGEAAGEAHTDNGWDDEEDGYL